MDKYPRLWTISITTTTFTIITILEATPSPTSPAIQQGGYEEEKNVEEE
jgi:hypothetical protein